MKNVVVKIDNLGRIIIPKEFCDSLNIKDNDLLQLYFNTNEKENYISIKKKN